MALLSREFNSQTLKYFLIHENISSHIWSSAVLCYILEVSGLKGDIQTLVKIKRTFFAKK